MLKIVFLNDRFIFNSVPEVVWAVPEVISVFIAHGLTVEQGGKKSDVAEDKQTEEERQFGRRQTGASYPDV